MIMSLKHREIKFEPRIKLSHNIYIKETRQNTGSSIFAGSRIFCFWFASLKINSTQHAKKVMSDSPGLVDFAIRQVNSVVNLHDGQVMFLEQFE